MRIVPFFVFITMDYNDLVEKFNNGDLDVVRYFNDYDTFFKILKKRGLMGEIDPKNATDGEQWQNEYLIWLSENDKESFYKWIPMLLNDVIIKDGVAYLDTNDRGDLAKLFCNNRNDISADTIETILSGDGDAWDPFWDTTDDVYRDVIEELDDDNLKHLGEYIVDSLKDVGIEPETDILYEIAEEQGNPEEVRITYDNVGKVIGSEETMKFLFNNGLEDLKSELYSLHSNAYNGAYESEIYERIWNELSTYFVGHGEFVMRPHRYKKDTQVQNFIIPIANFESNIVGFLQDNKGYGNSGTLEYWGSYLGMMGDWSDCLSFHSPDYADWSEVVKSINEIFSDYI
jgi:hypothetical protein